MWGRSIRITRLGGFDIKVDASWLLIAGLLIWSLSTGYFPAELPAADPATLLILATLAMLGLFGSLILHELAHSLVAVRLGLGIGGITLFLFGGVAELEEEPADPGTEWRVAIAGPLASLALAAVFWSSRSMAQLLDLGPAAVALLGYLAAINLTLALFNMVPAFPLDGGRVYRAVLWQRRGDLLAATRRAAAVSAFFAWGLIALGLMAMFGAGPAAGLWPILIGLFLLALGRASLRQVEIRQLTRGRTAADLMSRNPVTCRSDRTLAELVDGVFLANGVSFAPVVEDGQLLGFVDVHMVRRIDRENWATTRVDDVVEGLSERYVVAPDLPVPELLARMSETGRRKFLVVGGGDQLLGVVTLSDVLAYLNVSREIAS